MSDQLTPAEIQALKQLLQREQHAKKLSELPTRDTLDPTDNIYVTSNQGDHRATIGTLLNTIPAPTWGLITNKPTTFPPSTHAHPISEVTGLQDALNTKLETVTWAGVTNKPSTFPPSSHSHAWGTITGTLDNQTDLKNALNAKVNVSALGENNGVAELDHNGHVPAHQLPSFVDDVVEFPNLAAFPATGESGKIYIAIDTGVIYRWGETQYVEISASLALGTSDSTAYRGDRGKIAFDHSQATGNPHGTTAAEVGAVPLDLTALAALGADVEDGDTYVVRRDGTTYKVSHAELVGGLISSLIAENPHAVFRESLSPFGENIADANSAPSAGGWYYGYNMANVPGINRQYVLQFVYPGTQGHRFQLAFVPSSMRVYFRGEISGEWSAWREVNATPV